MPEGRLMNLSVALLSPPYTTLTYAAPEVFPSSLWQEGLRVLVPLGTGMVRAGMVLGAADAEAPVGVRLKQVLWPMERVPLCRATWLSMIRELAIRQMVSPGQVLGTVLPASLRGLRGRLRRSREGDKPEMIAPGALQRMDVAQRERLAQDWLEGRADWLVPHADAASSELCVLLKEPPWPVRPAAARQLAILEYLLEHGTVTRRELLNEQGPQSTPALATLVRNGLVSIRQQEAADDEPEPGMALLPPPEAPFALSEAQRAALARCVDAMDTGRPSTKLVYGVTGSGKTALYIELVRACLERGRSAFLLAPEVALALKLRRDVRQALGESAPLFFFHGYQSAGHKERLFCELARREAPCVVVGTRSALFLPLDNPGLIILDEEHDSSFKQDEGLTYQAKEVAWFRAKQGNGLLVLGSATPDIKTYHAALTGQVELLTLPERVGGGTLPEVRLVNIRNADLSESLLAPESLKALKETVKAGEQAVILLNRRGYAPLMYCLDCGTAARCPHCDIGLTYHKGRERLVCHYCGYSVPFPMLCPTCKGMHFLPMGQGTERLEEFLTGILPEDCGVLRLDRDSTRCPGRMESILEEFTAHRAQVLVGTQMLSKGHHFPDVTLAIVADGDLGLNTPDYRACERTFQLLVQSAGRAGRGEKPGKVFIQTRDPGHYCWDFIRWGDYPGFYEHEIALRQKRRYPPFARLALVRLAFPLDWEGGSAELARLAAVLRENGKAEGITVLGPAPAPLSVLRGRKRAQCLLKAASWNAIRKVYAALMAAKPHASMIVRLDMDPVNML